MRAIPWDKAVKEKAAVLLHRDDISHAHLRFHVCRLRHIDIDSLDIHHVERAEHEEDEKEEHDVDHRDDDDLGLVETLPVPEPHRAAPS